MSISETPFLQDNDQHSPPISDASIADVETDTHDNSEQLFALANEVMPGGVNSPVRAFGAVGGTPRFIARGQGAYMWDEDGEKYLDFVSSWGPLIHGHAAPFVHNAVKKQLDSGASFVRADEVGNRNGAVGVRMRAFD